MVADVEVDSFHGGTTDNPSAGATVVLSNTIGGAFTSLATMRFKRNASNGGDNDDASSNLNPMIIPSTGTNYSLHKSLKLKILSSGSIANEISNLRLRVATGSNALPTGFHIKAGPSGDGVAVNVTTGYAPAVDADMSSPFSAATTALAVPGDSVTIQSGVVANSGTGLPTTGAQPFAVLQMSIVAAETPVFTGALPAVTLQYTYDES